MTLLLNYTIRGKRTTCTKFIFKFDHNELKIVDRYKYLCIILQENLDYNVTTSVLTGAAGRALGAVISKFKSFRNAGYTAFSKMYESHVVPVIDYSAGVWGYSKFEEGGKIQKIWQLYTICEYIKMHQFWLLKETWAG